MNHHNTSDRRHWLLMLACCLAPLALILGLSLFGSALGGLSGVLAFVPAALCAFLMLTMIYMHRQGDAPAATSARSQSSMPDDKS